MFQILVTRCLSIVSERMHVYYDFSFTAILSYTAINLSVVKHLYRYFLLHIQVAEFWLKRCVSPYGNNYCVLTVPMSDVPILFIWKAVIIVCRILAVV